jgi:ribonuclease BN (tRNA processing enzyme)
MSDRLLVATILLTSNLPVLAKTNCSDKGVWLQVLGSGGPEINDQRASSGYLIWQDGHARILVDMGPGSMLRYEESGARIEDLEVILLTHLHVDHSADLPALVKASYFSERTKDLPLYGPSGNTLMPDTTTFVQSLFSEATGAYRYLSGYLTGGEAFRLLTYNVSAVDLSMQSIKEKFEFKITAIAVHHGPVPALAWRVDIDGRAIAFSGDMNGDNHTLEKLAAGADLLVAHHAIPQEATGAARNLHMPPSVIGEIAATTKVRQLILSHRMLRTIGLETESTAEIRKNYKGKMTFADDGQCFWVN